MRYLLPVSKEFRTETLVLSNEKYEEYLKYVLPVDTLLSKEWGEIELNLTFIMLDNDVDGNVVQRVRKTGNHILTVTKIPDWDSVIPDPALAELDQRIIAQTAQIKVLEALAETLESSKVDNLVYDSKADTLQLSANGIGVGSKVSLKEVMDGGIPVVDFDSNSGGSSDKEDEYDNTVEF